MGVLGDALARASGDTVDGEGRAGVEGDEAMQGVEHGIHMSTDNHNDDPNHHDHHNQDNNHHHQEQDPHRQLDDQLVGLTEMTFKGPIIGGVYQHCFEGHAPVIAPPTAAGKYIPS